MERVAPGSSRRVLVIGGRGFIGRRSVEALERRRHEVWTLGRSAEEGRHLAGDRSQPGGLSAAVGERRFDAVVDLAAYHPREVAEAVELFGSRVGRYVFVSSGVVHRDLHGRPAREEDALLPEGEPPAGDIDYAWGKRWCEAVLARAARSGFPAAAVRPPAVLGRDDRTSRIAGYLARIADGGALLVPSGLLDRGIGVAWSKDVGTVCALLVEGEEPRLAYNVGFADLTLRRFLAECAAALGTPPPELVEAGADELAAAGLDAFDVSPYGPDPVRPGGYDLTRLRTELGFEPSPLRAALDECADWFRAAQPQARGYERRPDELALASRLSRASGS